jgi:hypothetical protein
MSCPRCGFPAAVDTCALCGQSQFDEFEMARYDCTISGRFEFTLAFPDQRQFNPVKELLTGSILHRLTSEQRPRVFIFFPDGQDQTLLPFLKILHGMPCWNLLVNGRYRPYVEELWLPMLELLSITRQQE